MMGAVSSTLPPETRDERTVACSCRGGADSPGRTKLANNFPSAVYNAARRSVALLRTALTFWLATVRSLVIRAEAVEVPRMLDWVSRSDTQESRYTLRSCRSMPTPAARSAIAVVVTTMRIILPRTDRGAPEGAGRTI